MPRRLLEWIGLTAAMLAVAVFCVGAAATMGRYLTAVTGRPAAEVSQPDPYYAYVGTTGKIRVWTDPDTDCQYLVTYSAGTTLVPRTGRDGLQVCTRPTRTAEEPIR